MVDVDLVQRLNSPKLTDEERAVFSTFVNDMLRWCTDDILGVRS